MKIKIEFPVGEDVIGNLVNLAQILLSDGTDMTVERYYKEMIEYGHFTEKEATEDLKHHINKMLSKFCDSGFD